ncbi:hypothetical protein HMN09_01081300 [Mycena chlorophos]|uniref:Uncharacterized protein n=1 Tax=Mycena chlorophos TaxID=658473 RepID=A0A8H6SD29_MYCCL|nr:hypothetical protein HMN09_01081300 [Mycena chlorophos]
MTSQLSCSPHTQTVFAAFEKDVDQSPLLPVRAPATSASVIDEVPQPRDCLTKHEYDRCALKRPVGHNLSLTTLAGMPAGGRCIRTFLRDPPSTSLALLLVQERRLATNAVALVWSLPLARQACCRSCRRER